MIKIDLITGFLGSGKTTFIKKYVNYLLSLGLRVGILENDFGAVNVDMMLLQELQSDRCDIEMVSGACDKDCHKRRFKTKLIAMAMMGYDRVVVEPSGIFDTDEFFDTLREEPLDNWYEIGSTIAIVDTRLVGLSEESEFLLASQCAVAGKIVFSHTKGCSQTDIDRVKKNIEKSMDKIQAKRSLDNAFITKEWEDFCDKDYAEIMNCGCVLQSFVKLYDETDSFKSLYFLNIDPEPMQLIDIAKKMLADSECGRVFRVKGFTNYNNEWYELNAAHESHELKKVKNGQSIIIVIGEGLQKDKINRYFGI